MSALSQDQDAYLRALYAPRGRARPVWLKRLAWHAFSVVAHRVIRRAQRTPYEHLPGYMDRWWYTKPADSREYRGSRIHRILRSDLDRDLHSHPFHFVTVILRGGYYEITPRDQRQHPSLDPVHYIRKWHGPGSVLIRRAHHRHRLELPNGSRAWTWFFQGRKFWEWGFFAASAFIHWTKYSIQPGAPQGRGS